MVSISDLATMRALNLSDFLSKLEFGEEMEVYTPNSRSDEKCPSGPMIFLKAFMISRRSFVSDIRGCSAKEMLKMRCAV